MAISYIATFCLGMAVAQAFLSGYIRHLAKKFDNHSMIHRLLFTFSEVEIVFGFWAGIYLASLAFVKGLDTVRSFVNAQSFVEPLFVFVVMVICATRPILYGVEKLLVLVSRVLPLPPPIAFFLSAITIGPILGSLISEPAAMTIVAMILSQRFFSADSSLYFVYVTLGVLFVNVSIGGVLTPYAAPPVLLVAGIWHWDLVYMLQHFGWRAVLGVFLNGMLISLIFRSEIVNGTMRATEPANSGEYPPEPNPPYWLVGVHLLFLGLVILEVHSPLRFGVVFLVFLGAARLFGKFQSRLKLKEAGLVALFLSGLVVLGEPQKWWLQPLLDSLQPLAMYFSAIVVTSVVDNAALTYLGAQVVGLSEAAKFSLVAGSVVGGGLTVIANAPNPIGLGIFSESLGRKGFKPLYLFFGALWPTLVAACSFLSF